MFHYLYPIFKKKTSILKLISTWQHWLRIVLGIFTSVLGLSLFISLFFKISLPDNFLRIIFIIGSQLLMYTGLFIIMPFGPFKSVVQEKFGSYLGLKFNELNMTREILEKLNMLNSNTILAIVNQGEVYIKEKRFDPIFIKTKFLLVIIVSFITSAAMLLLKDFSQKMLETIGWASLLLFSLLYILWLLIFVYNVQYESMIDFIYNLKLIEANGVTNGFIKNVPSKQDLIK
jgi:hypothetical protein